MDRSKHDLFEAHRATMAEVLGLDHLNPDWNASVTNSLVMAATVAELFATFPLDDTFDEIAPVFTPVSPPIDAATEDQIS